MAHKFTFPFVPPWEDLRQTTDLPGGGKAYVFDTCVERDPAKVAQIEEEIGLILAQAERRKLIRAMEAGT